MHMLLFIIIALWQSVAHVTATPTPQQKFELFAAAQSGDPNRFLKVLQTIVPDKDRRKEADLLNSLYDQEGDAILHYLVKAHRASLLGMLLERCPRLNKNIRQCIPSNALPGLKPIDLIDLEWDQELRELLTTGPQAYRPPSMSALPKPQVSQSRGCS